MAEFTWGSSATLPPEFYGPTSTTGGTVNWVTEPSSCELADRAADEQIQMLLADLALFKRRPWLMYKPWWLCLTGWRGLVCVADVLGMDRFQWFRQYHGDCVTRQITRAS